MDLLELLSSYRKHAEAHAAVDYADPASVRSANAAADAMREIAFTLQHSDEATIRKFATFLDDPRSPAAAWAAHHLLELMSPPADIAEHALRVIEQRAKANDLTAIGERFWLKEWHAKNSERAASRPRRDSL